MPSSAAQPSSPPRSWRTLAIAWALIVASAVCGFYAVFGIMLQPAPAPPLETTPTKVPALTKHILLLVIDGLRYDVATDETKLPHFAAGMKEHASGVMWAGQVTMSSSAVLAYGTGQWGQLEQLVLNMFPSPPLADSWFGYGKAAGMKFSVAGEKTWHQMYAKSVHRALLDPPGAAMDKDFNDQTFSDARELLAEDPNFLAAHFTTPDHQSHVYGPLSEAYADHIRGYDADVEVFLGELGPEWTVIVTSDHGASEGGAHGIGVPEQRRVPFYAYGPGIRKGARIASCGQVDVANTIAVLFGLPLPAHSRGHTLVELLDIDGPTKRQIACAEATRAVRHAEARLDQQRPDLAEEAQAVCHLDDAKAATARSRALLAKVDEIAVSKFGISSPVLWWLMAGLALCALASGLVLLGRRIVPAIPGVAAVVAITVALVFQVERFEGDVPNMIRVPLFMLCNLLAVGLVFFPGRSAHWLDGNPKWAAALIPGLLIAAYPANAQPESFVAVAVITLFFLLAGHQASGDGHVFRSGRLRISRLRMVLVVLLVVVLIPAGTKQQDVHVPWLARHLSPVIAAAFAAIVLWAVGRARRLGFGAAEKRQLAIGLPIALAAFAYMPLATPTPGRLAVVVLAAAAAAAALRRQRSLALYLGFASYAMLARPFEVFAVLATLALAETIGQTLAEGADDAEPRLSTLALVVTFTFGLLYVQRVAIQGGLDIGAFQPAATFGDPAPSWVVVGTGMTLKWLIPAMMAVGAMLAYWPLRLRLMVLRALVVAYLVRFTTVLLMLTVAGDSFSTGQRGLGDLPFTLLATVAVGLVWLGVNITGPPKVEATS